MRSPLVRVIQVRARLVASPRRSARFAVCARQRAPSRRPVAVLKPHGSADITAGVNATRCLSTSRAIAAWCSLVGIGACALVLVLATGTGVAERPQAPVVKHLPALAVLQAGVLTVVQDGVSTGIGPVRVKGAVKPMTVADFQWSADGRYLGWEQSDPITGRGAIGWYDTVAHRRTSWQFPSPVRRRLVCEQFGVGAACGR